MKKALLALAVLMGLAATTFAVDFVWKDVNETAAKVFKNRTVKDPAVIKETEESLAAVTTKNDNEKLRLIQIKAWLYLQKTGSTDFNAVKTYVDQEISTAKLEKPLSAGRYVGLFNFWWDQPTWGSAIYNFMKTQPGYEAFGDAGLWANAVGQYAEAYELYMITKGWPQRAMSIALYKLDDPAKAFAAAKLITGQTYGAAIVKEVVRLTVSKLVGNDTVSAADMKVFLQNVNRKYSAQLIVDKTTWEPVIAQIRTVLETY